MASLSPNEFIVNTYLKVLLTLRCLNLIYMPSIGIHIYIIFSSCSKFVHTLFVTDVSLCDSEPSDLAHSLKCD